MFDFFQKHKRIGQVILGLIAITFVTWGVESYTSMRAGRDTVATVNGFEISQREFAQQLQQQQEQLRRLLGGAVDPQALDSPESRSALLESLISQRLVASQAARQHLIMSREAVIDAITKAPEFQENGQFSPALYSGYLASRGLTDQANVAQLRSQLPLARLVGSISDTAIAPRSVVQRLAAIEAQQREVSEARIPVQQFLPQAKVDEPEAKAYYDANLADYRTPERVRAEYLVLSAENLGRGEPVSEDEIKAAYEARASEYRVEEQRRASHILVKTKEEAEKLLAEVKKNPARFAELAKKHSQDPGSAEKGGELDWFTRGMMVKPFEDAVFKLGQNETGLVQSEFGFHVVRVTGVRPGKAKPLAEVRQELADQLARQKGGIINVASVAAFIPWGNVTYNATKAYLVAFSESLQADVHHSGVRVQALCPGFTVTEFHDSPELASIRRVPLPGFLWLNADYVVQESLKALDRNKVICIPGLPYRLIVALGRSSLTGPIVRAVALRLRSRSRH